MKKTRLQEAQEEYNKRKDDIAGFRSIYERRLDLLQTIFEIDFKENPTAEEIAWMEPLVDECYCFINTENF